MKIAITGANGFVGNQLIKTLKSLGHIPVAIIRKSASIPKEPCAIREVDYNSETSLKSAVSDVEAIIHNAAKTKTLYPEEMLAANVGITANVVKAINSQSSRIHLIFISSQAASGPSSCAISESDTPHPVSIYGKSKLYAERLIASQCEQPWTIVRPCSVYGPGDKDFLQMFRAIKLGINFQIGERDNLLNLIHVSQLADFIAMLPNKEAVFKETFFATDGQVYSQKEMVEAIAKIMKAKSIQVRIPEALATFIFAASETYGRLKHQPQTMNREKLKEILAEGWLANPDKAQKILGWNPPPQFKHFIEETYQWYLQNGWL